MSRIWCSEFITLDGVVEAPEEWMAAVASHESNALVEDDVRSADRMLMGRRTFEELSSFWPDLPDDVPIAAVTNQAAKTVVSRTLRAASWGPDTQLRTDAGAAVRELAEAGQDVSVTGSPTVVRELLRTGLLQEIRLFVVPVVRGYGGRLFDQGWNADLTARQVRRLPNGVVRLVYDIAA